MAAVYIEHDERATGWLGDRQADEFEDWAQDFDAFLSTPAGLAWLDDQADAWSLQRAAECYGTRPGLSH